MTFSEVMFGHECPFISEQKKDYQLFLKKLLLKKIGDVNIRKKNQTRMTVLGLLQR